MAGLVFVAACGSDAKAKPPTTSVAPSADAAADAWIALHDSNPGASTNPDEMHCLYRLYRTFTPAELAEVADPNAKMSADLSSRLTDGTNACYSGN